MKNFTKEQMEQMQTQVEQIMAQLSEGKSAREICAQMYVDGLENKTVSQGEAMADAIMDSITSFDRDYDRAKTDVDAFVDAFVDDICKDKSLAERCTYLMKLIAAISGAKSMLDADTDEKREQARNMVAGAEAAQIFEGEATEALELKLRDQLKNALKGSNIMVSTLEAQSEKLREIESEDEAAALLVEAGTRNNDYRAIMAMQAYINIKNGMYEDIPADLSAAQVATMVCAYTEEIHILQQVEQNHLGEDVAHALLSILGLVAIMHMAGAALIVGVSVCAHMFGTILCIPAMMVVLTTVYQATERIMDNWISASGKIVHYTAVGVKAIYTGAARVLDFAVTHTKSALSWLTTKAVSAVCRLMDVLRAGHTAQNAEQQASVSAEDLEEAVDEEAAETEIAEEETEPEEEHEVE